MPKQPSNIWMMAGLMDLRLESKWIIKTNNLTPKRPKFCKHNKKEALKIFHLENHIKTIAHHLKTKKKDRKIHCLKLNPERKIAYIKNPSENHLTKNKYIFVYFKG